MKWKSGLLEVLKFIKINKNPIKNFCIKNKSELLLIEL